MMWALRWLLAASLALLPLSESFAAAGLTTVSVLDSGGTARTFTVNSTTGAVTGGLTATQTICDLTTPTQCTAVSSGGALSVNVVSATGLAQGSTTSGQTGSMVMGAVTTAAPTYTTAQTSPLSVDLLGNLRVLPSLDPCATAVKVNQTISFQTTSLTQQIAANSTNKIYICSLSLIASAATVFSISGGTGSNCASNQLGILGVAGSATHGLSLAANGGLTLGSGSGTVAVTAASSEICLVQSGAGDLSGNITYVYAP